MKLRHFLPPGVPGLVGLLLMALLGCLPACKALPPPAPPPPPVVVQPPEPEPPALLPRVEDPRFTRLDGVVKQELAAGGFPGAVVLVGHQGRVVYRKAFGHRAVIPRMEPMTPDTIFDLASLTKVIATAPALMHLAEAGRLRLDQPVARYWPEFGKNGKARLTVRQLLLHTSGLRADVNSRVGWWGYEGAVAAVAEDHPVNPPGSAFLYSDANFVALGEIVRRVSGVPLDAYCQQKLYQPLGMRHTRFRPPPAWQSRIAPTDQQGDRLRWGEVSDPTAHRMGGVAGNAGLFGNADDLAIFAQMLLDGGQSRGRRLFREQTLAAMTKAHPVPGSFTLRGLGWDVQSPFSKAFNAAFPKGAYGHTGYTGTSLWIEPRSRTFLIILTSRLHPNGRGNVKQLRARLSAALAQAVPMGPPARVAADDGDADEPVTAGHGQADPPTRVRTGLDVLAASGFAPLAGKNLGLITNHSGIDAARRAAVNLLRRAPRVKLRVLFSPEHGLAGNLDEKVPSGRDPLSGLTVYSLYGDVKKPTPRMLQGLDALVYDIQDVGVRYYTYITTMAYAMEAAAAAGLDFYVLDRPAPLTAASVQGPMLDPDLRSFIAYFPLPVRYGMTPGELAHLFNRENRIGARLHVVKMQGYRREAWFDELGLPWVNPSPNLRSLTQAILYAGVGLIESSNVSVGRGTPTPFEVVGAPWISGPELARYLQNRHLSGVAFEAVVFIPTASRHRHQRCEGVRLRLVDRDALDAPALGLELAAALYRLYPGKFDLGSTLTMMGSRQTVQALKNGQDPQNIRRSWQPGLEAFRRLRQQYLLYP